ncbi:MAG: hypothetical protein KME12_15700 [Trichocoleus desertorum ATA4-8-CV12]|jgi:hypothetical protein|nr:hypothetical protein [Trichocoleus desertorum ATA4-8-CV12]
MNRFLTLGVGSWIAWNCCLSLAQAQSISYLPCQPIVTGFNTTQQDDVIVLGQRNDYPYMVAVPSQSRGTLDAVRQCVPDAFITRSRLGPYVHAGSFPTRAGAESLAWFLRSRGLDSRVVYTR